MALQKYKHDSPYSYALGATLVDELFRTKPNLINRVFLRPTAKHGTDIDRIISSLRLKNIKIIESNKAFNILGAKDNCILIAEFQKTSTPLSDAKNHLVLVNPSDAGNLGTIMRSCAAFGYTDIAIITPAVDPYDPKTIRASMGAFFHLNIHQYATFDEYLQFNPHRNLYAFVLDSTAKPLDEISDDDKIAIILGNEAAGLPENFTTNYGATAVFIPQSSNVDSLNLGVATSLALYHFREKR